MARRHPFLVALVLFPALSLPAAGWAGEARMGFVLESGMVIQGDVVASDPEALTIESSSLGRIRVSRDSVRQVKEPVSELSRHTSAHERLPPTDRQNGAVLDIRTRQRVAGESAELLQHALSIRLVEPLPAKIAE
jgi:hypothetical protein